MKVKDLIAILQTMPQNIPVTGYNGQEETEEVTRKGIRHFKKGERPFYRVNGKRTDGEHVDIMGF